VEAQRLALVGFNGERPDREKLRQLYEQHGRGLAAFACTFVRGFAAAEDVLHQVFERLLRSNIILPDPPVPYLYRAVKNAALNHLRDRSRDVELTGDWLQAPPGMQETGIMLASLLDSLPEEQREVIVLRVWAQMTFDEVADTLGIPLKTAASRYRYGLEKLRAEFQPKAKG
jgi:RNA polymerase sigma-70 factor (ECF subfamily)